MNVFLIARYRRKAEMREVRERLQGLGFGVTSRWLDEREINDDGTPHTYDTATEEELRQYARSDLMDLARSDVVLMFSGKSTNGGMFVEYGFALGLLPIVIVGGPENLYGHLNEEDLVWHVDTLEGAIELLTGWAEADQDSTESEAA